MVYVTGAMHGDIARYKEKPIKRLRSGDYLIVCGDFGFLNPPVQDKKAIQLHKKAIERINAMPFTTLFIGGVYDSFPTENWEEIRWMGGIAHRVYDNIIHLCDNQIYCIDEDYYYTLGGGTLTEQELELAPLSDRPLPDPHLAQKAKEILATRKNVVDYIISHQCPTAILNCIGKNASDHLDHITLVLDSIMRDCLYKKWFSSRHAIDRLVPPGYHCLHRNVVPVRGV